MDQPRRAVAVQAHRSKPQKCNRRPALAHHLARMALLTPVVVVKPARRLRRWDFSHQARRQGSRRRRSTSAGTWRRAPTCSRQSPSPTRLTSPGGDSAKAPRQRWLAVRFAPGYLALSREQDPRRRDDGRRLLAAALASSALRGLEPGTRRRRRPLSTPRRHCRTSALGRDAAVYADADHTPAWDELRARRLTIGSLSLPSAIAEARTSSSVATAGRGMKLNSWRVCSGPTVRSRDRDWRLLGRTYLGRPFWTMGCEPALVRR
jgi:hypothetical protein